MRFVSQDDAALSNSQGEPLGSNFYAYCLNDPCNNSDLSGFGPWTRYLTLMDYRSIHNKVADSVRNKIGGTAIREVYVKGDKGKGFLDVYDVAKNQYYEIKSIGSAELKSTKKQMQKHDAAKCPGSKHKVKRGTKNMSGSFYYGAWKIEYYSYAKGLVVYTHEWNQKIYNTHVAVKVVVVAGITALVLATGGSAAPAYGLILI